MAGPLYRLNYHLKSIADDPRQLRPIQFRKGDHFEEVEENFNRMVESLRKR